MSHLGSRQSLYVYMLHNSKRDVFLTFNPISLTSGGGCYRVRVCDICLEMGPPLCCVYMSIQLISGM